MYRYVYIQDFHQECFKCQRQRAPNWQKGGEEGDSTDTVTAWDKNPQIRLKWPRPPILT